MDDGKLSVAEIDGAFSQARQEVEAKAEEASATKKEKSATA
jgi:hypothetical protein